MRSSTALSARDGQTRWMNALIGNSQQSRSRTTPRSQFRVPRTARRRRCSTCGSESDLGSATQFERSGASAFGWTHGCCIACTSTQLRCRWRYVLQRPELATLADSIKTAGLWRSAAAVVNSMDKLTKATGRGHALARLEVRQATDACAPQKHLLPLFPLLQACRAEELYSAVDSTNGILKSH